MFILDYNELYLEWWKMTDGVTIIVRFGQDEKTVDQHISVSATRTQFGIIQCHIEFTKL